MDSVDKWHEEQVRKQTIANELMPTLIGKTLEEAREATNEKKLQHRVRILDGKGCIGTCDLQPSRLNFNVEKNIVIDIHLG